MKTRLGLLRLSSIGTRRLSATLGTALFAAASALAGCSPAPTANPLADVAGFCQEKATAECQIAPLCAIDPMTCTNARDSLCMSDATSATASGVRTYDAANAKACLDAVNRAYSGNQAIVIPYATLEGPGSTTDLCNRVFTGNLGINTVCQTDYDCAGAAICAPVVPGSTTHVCANPVTVTMDGFCDNPGSMCATDLYCAVQTSGAGQCEPAAGLGASCADGVACVSEALCGASQTCIARQPSGGGCSSDAQCAPTAPYCDPASNVCAAGLTFAQGGTDCVAFIHPGTGPTVATPTTDAASSVDAAEIDSSATSDASPD
ncbi:MAG TPA: hypothetical protein VK841_24970 [Polyangiaceae bacterium]|jgi:hypothetical protein|nr:hypothetical protein [Polyangiaceae bacterium]